MDVLRKVKQALGAAQNLAALAQQQSDRNVERALLSSALMQLELALSFYLQRKNKTVGAEILTVEAVDYLIDSGSAEGDFVNFYQRADSPIKLLLDLSSQLRRFPVRSDQGLKGAIFQSDNHESFSANNLIISDKSAKSEQHLQVRGDQIEFIQRHFSKYIEVQIQFLDEY